MPRHRFELTGTWDGEPLRPDEWARFELSIEEAPDHVDSRHEATSALDTSESDESDESNGESTDRVLPQAAELARDREVRLRIEAAFHDDPAPSEPPGRRDALWEFEVVELFLLGENDEYLEIELGPHGHWLGLRLTGRRRVVDDRIPIELSVARSGDRWTAEARLPGRCLPPGLHAANAYAIHGQGASRRYLASRPVPGDRPDFHRLEHFEPLDPHPL